MASLLWKHVFERDARRFYTAFTDLDVRSNPKLQAQFGELAKRNQIIDLAGPDPRTAGARKGAQKRVEKNNKTKKNQ